MIKCEPVYTEERESEREREREDYFRGEFFHEICGGRVCQAFSPLNEVKLFHLFIGVIILKKNKNLRHLINLLVICQSFYPHTPSFILL